MIRLSNPTSKISIETETLLPTSQWPKTNSQDILVISLKLIQLFTMIAITVMQQLAVKRNSSSTFFSDLYEVSSYLFYSCLLLVCNLNYIS